MTIAEGHRARQPAMKVEAVPGYVMQTPHGRARAMRCMECRGYVDLDLRHLPRWFRPEKETP